MRRLLASSRAALSPLPTVSPLRLLAVMDGLIGPPQSDDHHKDHPLYWTNTEGGLVEEEYFWREHQQWLEYDRRYLRYY